MCDGVLSPCNDAVTKSAVDFVAREPNESEACCSAGPMARGLEPAEPVQVDDFGERGKRLAAVFVIEPAQAAVTLRVVVEVNSDTALPAGDGCAATGAERSLRTAAAGRHWIESHRVPQIRIAPASQSHEDISAPTERWSMAVDDSTTEGFSCARWHEKTNRRTVSRSLATASVEGVRWNFRCRPRDLALVPVGPAGRAIA